MRTLQHLHGREQVAEVLGMQAALATFLVTRTFWHGERGAIQNSPHTGVPAICQAAGRWAKAFQRALRVDRI
jgi:hypothetical protein